jgi:hypothetical protein
MRSSRRRQIGKRMDKGSGIGKEVPIMPDAIEKLTHEKGVGQPLDTDDRCIVDATAHKTTNPCFAEPCISNSEAHTQTFERSQMESYATLGSSDIAICGHHASVPVWILSRNRINQSKRELRHRHHRLSRLSTIRSLHRQTACTYIGIG